MEELKSAINWFEIPVIDFERVVRFYSDIYDTEGNHVYLHSMG